MNTATANNLFHPYTIINQGRSTLQLQPGKAQKTGIIVLRIMPVIMVAIGIILFVTQKDILFLAMFGGIGLIEAFIFSFIKIPAAISMDSMGFTLETLSIKGRKETYYLWNDVEYIRHKTISAKNSTSLSYEAVLKTGKGLSFLSFPNYHTKKQVIPEINVLLAQISGKQIAEK
jgi:hypothetical protein